MTELLVRLGAALVGQLRRLSNEQIEFRFSPEYIDDPERPVLGQTFEEDITRVHRSRMRAPPWFSNLLPEGPLRTLLAERAGVHAEREFGLLGVLGRDLAGAVVIEPAEEPLIEPEGRPSPAERPSGEELYFSLAGMQLKFSVLKRHDKLTLPVSGTGGRYIAKLPDRRFSGVPENEHAMMSWARSSGIDVPSHELRPVAEIERLPVEVFAQGIDPQDMAFVIERFDRRGEARIHMEEMAQVFAIGTSPESEKYKHRSYKSIGQVIAALDPDGLEEYVRRLVFMISSGNSDAHHKNWAFIYPEGRRARLAPAYDLLCTIHHLPQETFALRLGRTKRYEDVTPDVFARLAPAWGVEEQELRRWVDRAHERVMDAFESATPDMDKRLVRTLREHHARLQLG